MVTESTLGKAVELPRPHVRLELTIPRLCVEDGKPLPETGEFLRRKLLHCSLDLLRSLRITTPPLARTVQCRR